MSEYMNEYEQDTISTVELVIEVEGMTQRELDRFLGGVNRRG